MSMLKAAILKCDDVLDKFQVSYGGYPEMIRSSFRKIDKNIEFDVFDSRKGEQPEHIEDYAFYVITGSKHSVYEKLSWIKDLVVLLQELEQRDIKVFGICFGHQLIAFSKGCDVNKSSKGWGVGVAQNKIKVKDFFNWPKSSLNMLVSHQDQVESLTAEATVLATSAFCENFMVQWSFNTISVQGHPEWEKGYSRDLMNDRRDRIEHDVIESGIASLDKEIDNCLFNRAILNFLLPKLSDAKAKL